MDGKSIVYCEGAFNTPNGKTAHGLVRFTERYHVLSVVDSRYAGNDAGEVLDGISKNIPIHCSVNESVESAMKNGQVPTHFVIGIAPDGGSINQRIKEDIITAMDLGLHIDSGLHDYLTDDHELLKKAVLNSVKIRDIRKPPLKSQLHFFTGKIEMVKCSKIAVLGTDSAIGKRTTAWIMVHGLRSVGIKTEMIGTGQTAWLQGARYGIIIDSLINDFVSGEIEHAVYTAWNTEKPEVLVIEGQGSLLNPAYPGGFEILAAARPDVIILQHAPKRIEYDGFPGYKIEPLVHQIKAIEIISGKKISAITINHENMTHDELASEKEQIKILTGLPAFDPLWEEPAGLIQTIRQLLSDKNGKEKNNQGLQQAVTRI